MPLPPEPKDAIGSGAEPVRSLLEPMGKLRRLGRQFLCHSDFGSCGYIAMPSSALSEAFRSLVRSDELAVFDMHIRDVRRQF
jgi:hypothetical protein